MGCWPSLTRAQGAKGKLRALSPCPLPEPQPQSLTPALETQARQVPSHRVHFVKWVTPLRPCSRPCSRLPPQGQRAPCKRFTDDAWPLTRPLTGCRAKNKPSQAQAAQTCSSRWNLWAQLLEGRSKLRPGTGFQGMRLTWQCMSTLRSSFASWPACCTPAVSGLDLQLTARQLPRLDLWGRPDSACSLRAAAAAKGTVSTPMPCNARLRLRWMERLQASIIRKRLIQGVLQP